MKKVLLDTNIIIHREAANLREGSRIGLLFRWLEKLNYQKWFHPLTRDELARNKNPGTVKTFSVKLENYNELKTSAPLSEAIQRIQQYDKNENDQSDTLLLNEVYEGRVDILITEDEKIHEKAMSLSIAEKVRKIDDFLHEVTSAYPDLTDYKVLSIRLEYFGNLDISDSFFDSFKKDYQGFTDWFAGKSNEECYVSMDGNGKIVAFLYLKVEGTTENYANIQPSFAPKKRLKIGTFKVISTGYKLGERFLRIIFDNALRQKVEEIYVTIFADDDAPPERSELVHLLEDWGFYLHGTKTSPDGKERVYVRDFSKKFNPDNIKYSYPFISAEQRKFIVPIWPEYHTDLLPDSILTNEEPENFSESKVHRNAIHKVYISRSINRDLNKGDIIIFYRTGGLHRSVVTTIGMVDSVTTDIPDIDKFISLCGGRSVFTHDELYEYWEYDKKSRPFVVDFLYMHSFPRPFLNMKKLIGMGIIQDVNSAPRGFEPISDDHFTLLMEKTNASGIVVN